MALVSRQSIQGDLRVLEVSVGGPMVARPLFDRNLTSPAVSPDGRWLVYVPVARTVESVGPAFAAHAADHLEAIRLGGSGVPVPLALALPGETGQPAFSRDGRALYVVQFLADTNQDGAVDAGDHGVLFRVPVAWSGDTPVVGAPEQLTETSWNCEYPAPFVDRLIATCSKDSDLDVYSMPLDGEVPGEWGPADPRRGDRERLHARRAAAPREPPAGARTTLGERSAMLALVLLHLQNEDFLAAQFYAARIHGIVDASTVGISLPLGVLVEQKKAQRRKEQGRLTEGFKPEALERLGKLGENPRNSPMAEDLRHLVRSVIATSVADEALARKELELVTIDGTTPAPIVDAYYRQVDATYRVLDDRDALVAACRQLADDPGLSPDEQLRYARAAARAVVRGLPYDDADAALVRERARGPRERTGAALRARPGADRPRLA